MNAIVDESRRRQFESDWSSGQQVAIDQYLPSVESESYLPTLEELVCIDMEFRWKNSSDRSAEKPPLLEWYLESFPELRQSDLVQRLIDQEIWVRHHSPSPARADEYVERFPQLQFSVSTFRRMIGQCTTISLDRGTGGGFKESGLTDPEVEGYEIVRMLGRGGMGVVYLARHLASNRSVAIKLATLGNLSPEIRTEFLNRVHQEIRASASLRHDHVMPVFEIGDVGGHPYYTMPVLDSDLGSELREGPLGNRMAAKYAAQAARGIHAAHLAGLLHRDIKPQNLMLDRSQDRVMVADFGLARCASESQDLTRTGQILGTPPYMSPEQIVDPAKVDVRADVYSLGATLYHLLTGRPPLVGSETAETIRQVMGQDPLPAREQNPAVDLDLETICMRCLLKEPSLRYESASAFADDLERYLRDEPILARPLSQWERLTRWQRRNPSLAKLSFALLFALIAIACVGLFGWWSTQRQLSRFQASVQQGHLAIDDLFTFVRTEPLLQEPGNEMVRRDLLERGRKHYRLLAEIADEDPSLAKDRFIARVAGALIAFELDGPEASLKSFQVAIAAAQALPVEVRSAARVQTAVGDAWIGLGQAQRRVGQLKSALDSFQKAILVRKEIAKGPGEILETDRKLANAIMNRGLIYQATGEFEASAKDLSAAQTMRQTLITRSPDNMKLRRDFAQGQFNQSRLHAIQGQLPDAIELLEEATQSFQQLTTQYPAVSSLWLRRVECLLTESILTASMEENRDAISTVSDPLIEAIEFLRILSNLAPNNRSYLLKLAELYHQTIDGLLMRGDIDDAQELHEAAASQILGRLSSDDQLDGRLCRLHQSRLHGLILLERGETQRSHQVLSKALRSWEMATESLSPAAADPGGQWQSLLGLVESLEQNSKDLIN